MSRVRSTVKAAKNLADRANLRTGLAVTKAGPATTRRVKKRGRNVNVAAGAGAAGAGGVGASSLFKDDKKKSGSGGKRLAPGAGVLRPDSGSKPTAKKKTWKDVKSVAAAKKAGLKHYTGADGKKKLAITKEELGRKKGETLTQAYNRAEGKTPRKSSTTAAKKPAAKKKVGGIRKFLLGDDGKFGGARGAIDFLPGKSRPKKPVKKAGGGMMKTKGMSKGGAMKTKGMSKGGAMKKKGMAMGGAMKKKGMAMGGAMKKKGMAMGGAMKKKGMSKGGAAKKFPDLTGDGKVTQADILKGRGVTKKKGGGMAKKGYAKGGMAKKGYAKGGPVRSKMSAKGGKRGGASRKPRGVGVALRGYGKALKK